MKSFFNFLTYLAILSISHAERLPNIYALLLPSGYSVDAFIESLNQGEADWQMVDGYVSNIDRDGWIACLLSGEYSQTNGYLAKGSGLYPERFQWIHLLKSREYATYIDSKASFWASESVIDALGLSLVDYVSFKPTDEPSFFLVDLEHDFKKPALVELLDQAPSDSIIILLGRADSMSEKIRMAFLVPGTDAIAIRTPYPQVVDIPANVSAWMGLDSTRFLHAQVWSDAEIESRQNHYFRSWNHLQDGENPAYFGLLQGDERLVYFYGVDFMERGEMAYDYDDFLEKVSVNQTEPHWLYTVGEASSVNLYSDPEYAAPIETLKQRLWQTRLAIGEGDRNFPHIEAIIYGSEEAD
jgi:hypothetical protein